MTSLQKLNDTSEHPVEEQPEVSKVESLKLNNEGLGGILFEEIPDLSSDRISEDAYNLLKFHGSYQQDDRDIREERRLQKLEPSYQFMIRTRLPGGVISPRQWLKLDAIATGYANGTLRLWGLKGTASMRLFSCFIIYLIHS